LVDNFEAQVADLRVKVATVEAELAGVKSEELRVLTRLDLMNVRIDGVVTEFGKLNQSLAKLMGRLSAYQIVIPAMALLIGVLGTLVAVHM